MDLTQGTQKEKNARAKKMMLWFGIISLLMGFAGWTSAFIVSSSREDWLTDFQLPTAFYYSTTVIILSSLTYILAKRAFEKTIKRRVHGGYMHTLFWELYLLFFNFMGFSEIIAQGYYFTGPTSNITMSYIFLIAAVHVVHVAAGLISFWWYCGIKLEKNILSDNLLGMELGATFWHFVDLLWVYLMLFFYFFQ